MLQFLTFCLIQHLASICKPISSFINRHIIACVCVQYILFICTRITPYYNGATISSFHFVNIYLYYILFFLYTLYINFIFLFFVFFQIKKPLIERKRRERINNCLGQLKSILLDNIKHNVSFSTCIRNYF